MYSIGATALDMGLINGDVIRYRFLFQARIFFVADYLMNPFIKKKSTFIIL